MERSSTLDTSAMKTAYVSHTLEAHERFGVGELYQFGSTRIELYAGSNESPPIVRLRMPGGLLAFSNVVQAKPTDDGGMVIDCAADEQVPHCSISVTKTGDIAFLYSPPPAPLSISENGISQTIKGQEYMQSTIDIEGTPEGVRVQIKGMVAAAPTLVDAKNQRSPLTFFLIEDNPNDPEKPVYHEVWAINRAKGELKALKLVKGNMIEAILYRHTFEVELGNHEKTTVVRHNLVRIIYTDKEKRGSSAKRQRVQR